MKRLTRARRPYHGGRRSPTWSAFLLFLVCVVELFGRIFVLGVTDTNIRLITEIDDPETVEEIRSAEPPAGGVFQEQFGSLSDFVQKIPPLFRK